MFLNNDYHTVFLISKSWTTTRSIHPRDWTLKRNTTITDNHTWSAACYSGMTGTLLSSSGFRPIHISLSRDFHSAALLFRGRLILVSVRPWGLVLLGLILDKTLFAIMKGHFINIVGKVIGTYSIFPKPRDSHRSAKHFLTWIWSSLSELWSSSNNLIISL